MADLVDSGFRVDRAAIRVRKSSFRSRLTSSRRNVIRWLDHNVCLD